MEDSGGEEEGEELEVAWEVGREEGCEGLLSELGGNPINHIYLFDEDLTLKKFQAVITGLP